MDVVAAVPNYVHAVDWGMAPDVAGCRELADVAADPNGDILVYGRDPAIVVRLSSDGDVLDTWNHERFVRPHGISVSQLDRVIHCVDDYAQAVLSFNPEGGLLASIDGIAAIGYTGYIRGDSFSVQRAAPPFCYPTAVDFGPDGSFYVSDGYGNARVHRFDSERRLVDMWGEPGGAVGDFVLPHSLLVHAGEVLVADRENDRVQVFDLDGSYLRSWSDCFRPAALCCDSDGIFYLAELGRVNVARGTAREMDFTAQTGRITARDRDGRILAVITTNGEERDPYFAPHGITIDAAGNLYVAEAYRTYFRDQAPEHAALHKFVREGA